jgi:cytochrome b pre-mRNA-processing protein 3
MRNKYLKDLFLQWRGILAAYDEGLVSGDAVLGAAVWRNLWKASPVEANAQDMDWEKVALVVAYMRRVLVDLSRVDEFSLVSAVSDGIFGYNPKDKMLVQGRSKGMDEPFTHDNGNRGA